MSLSSRILLLLLSPVYGFCAAVDWINFMGLAEPENLEGQSLSAYTTSVAIFLSWKLWLPAIIPNRFSYELGYVRWISFAFLIVPTI
ncbi:MAG TPA: hypothetical protein VL625_03620, partial [Patescibacteria group bacterium]|nr:hypothetical protein [Patescibacteria group bacterium]